MERRKEWFDQLTSCDVFCFSCASCSHTSVSRLAEGANAGLGSADGSRRGSRGGRRIRDGRLSVWLWVQKTHKVLVQRSGVWNLCHTGENTQEPTQWQSLHCWQQQGGSLHGDDDLTQRRRWGRLLVRRRHFWNKPPHSCQAPRLPHRYCTLLYSTVLYHHPTHRNTTALSWLPCCGGVHLILMQRDESSCNWT